MAISELLPTFVLRPLPPFSLELTVLLLQRRPLNQVDVWEDGRYWRVLQAAGEERLICAWQEDDAATPRVAVAVVGPPPDASTQAALESTLTRMLGTAVDTAPFFVRAAANPVMAPAARVLVGLKPPRFPSTMECLVNVITFQQISLTAALAIVGRLVARYGHQVGFAGHQYRAFPLAEVLAAVAPADLQALGFSRQKAQTLCYLARLVADGQLDLAQFEVLPSPEAAAELVRLPGIGPWSASVVLLRGLGRLDVFPRGDSGIRRGLARMYGSSQPLDDAAERALIDSFIPYQGLLYLFLAGVNLMAAGIVPTST
ncbi:MAG: DNA-3-methyladenine glycosylase family protein [Chloroflexota bacterium]